MTTSNDDTMDDPKRPVIDIGFGLGGGPPGRTERRCRDGQPHCGCGDDR